MNKFSGKSALPTPMSRSRQQLAQAYAPGALFTYEGGLGSCRSVPLKNEDVRLPESSKALIREQIKESIDGWWDIAKSGRKNLKHEIHIRQSLDARLIRHDNPYLPIDKLHFVEPREMGYVPFPLSFICRKRGCGLHRSCNKVSKLDWAASKFSEACPHGKDKCENSWQQVDVVLTHWSGAVEPLTPMYRLWKSTDGKVESFESDECRNCGKRTFRLENQSTSFSKWFFVCTNCQAPRPISRQDEATIEMLGAELENKTALRAELAMEPVSLRASAVFYPQTDRILLLQDADLLGLLQQERLDELRGKLGDLFRYPTAQLSDADKERMLTERGQGQQWRDHQQVAQLLNVMPPGSPGLDSLRRQQAEREAQWEATIFSQGDRGSAELQSRVKRRGEWQRRFDPIRQAIEHETLRVSTLTSGRRVSGKYCATDLTKVGHDVHLVPHGSQPPEHAKMAQAIGRQLDHLGIEQMYLLRDLEFCEYSFGYTRTSPTPIVERVLGGEEGEHLGMPVRLNLFDIIEGKTPVYCVTQKNEAFYIRLKEEAVREWLAQCDMPLPKNMPSERIGGWLIEQYPEEEFTRFLKAYHHGAETERSPYPFVYTLLHTIAHQFITIISELSGLDMGSFGEHIFTPDLAFVVYRRGTTMDLGNLSSMWRDNSDAHHGNLVLGRMLNRDTLRCGSESVCTRSGGACPDCIMIPETACLTRNELVSRSVLTGVGKPHWDPSDRPAAGFYQVVHDMLQPPAAAS